MKNYGFLPSQIDGEQYIFGASSLPKIILQSDRNWKPYLPKWESQLEKFDCYGCVPFGTLNAVETILERLNGGEYDFSERYTYNLAGINPPGSDPQFVSEVIRKYGLIEQAELPFTDTLEEFMKPRPMAVDKLSKGLDWLKKYDFGHEWVWTSYPGKERMIALVREALLYSPVCVSVSAWYEEDGVFVDNGLPNGHWTLCYGIDDDGGLLIFDSYALIYDGEIKNAFKKLHPDHKVLCAKRYHLEAKVEGEKLSWIAKILKWLLGDVEELKKNVDKLVPVTHTEVYNEVKESLKTNMIEKWAKAIDRWEGNTFGNNPGNIKYSPLIASWGAKKGKAGSDGGYFAVFDTPEQGFKALCNFLELGCKNELKAYKNARTLEKFMKIYAGNPPQGYIVGIAKDLGVSLDVDIKTFLP